MSTTYYESESATIYHGKAEEVLPGLVKGSADLVVTDPPYGVEYRSNYGQNFGPILNDDGTLPLAEIVAECLRVLRRKRHIYMFGGMGFGSAPVGGSTQLVWDKTRIGMGDLSLPWGPSHEIIDFAVSVPSASERAAGQGKLTARLRHGSIIRVASPGGRSVVRHPTEKPTALLRQLIESSSSVGETVLDPFLGCGSTAVAAILLGRKIVGVELDEQYLPGAVARIKVSEWLAAQMSAA